MGFVDDINLEGELSCFAIDVQAIIDSNLMTGLVLNASKCDITAKNVEMIEKFSIFKDFKRVEAEDMTILGAPVLEGRAVDNILKDKFDNLERSIKRFSTLQSHDVVCPLKNSIAMPKLLCILRTSPRANNPLLQ